MGWGELLYRGVMLLVGFTALVVVVGAGVSLWYDIVKALVDAAKRRR